MKLIAAMLLFVAPEMAIASDLQPKAAREVLQQISAGFDRYMDPAVAKKAQAALRANAARLAAIDDRERFASAVTDLLYAETRDGHVKLRVATTDAGANARLTTEQLEALSRRSAYGLLAIRRLPANIGYLKLRGFDQSEHGEALIDSAMKLLAGTDALIIDLRENRGGGGISDEALLGHLSREPIPMVSIRWREESGPDTIQQRKVRPAPGGPLYADKPLFVLTSNRTFSAAEEFTYDLKAAGRATLIGETTGGGANPANRTVPLGYGFRIFIPNGKVTHPTTGTNWEGVGISPDIVTPPGEALLEAYSRALKVARPMVSTPQTEAERAAALSDPKAALLADQSL